MKWIILFFLVIFPMACSNDLEEVQFSNASLNVKIAAAELGVGSEFALKTSGYKRGDAPVYVKGVDLKARNIEYNVKDIKQTFMFQSDDSNEGEDIVLTGLTVGINSITAKGIARYKAKNAYYLMFNEAEGSDLNSKADAYACLLYTSPSPRDVEESRMPSSA